MQICAVDLMPLLWGLCVLLSVALFLYGERVAPARTVPGAAGALVLYAIGAPPRRQVLVFLALYLLCAAVYALLSFLQHLRKAKKQARQQNLPEKI